MRRIAFLVATVVFAQQDRPSPEDFADSHKSAKSVHDELQGVHSQANQIINKAVADPLVKRAAQVQLGIKQCLASGDFRRIEADIFSKAASEAGRVATELESSTPVPSSASATLSEVLALLDQTERGISTLKAKGNLMEVDQVNLKNLLDLQTQLREALEVLRAIPRSGSSVQRAATAKKMRENQNLFLTKARGAKLLALSFDAQCRGYREVLGGLVEQAKLEELAASWQKITGPTPAGLLPPRPMVNPIPDDEKTQLLELLKKAEQTLSDPDELQRRVDRMKALVQNPGSHQAEPQSSQQERTNQ